MRPFRYAALRLLATMALLAVTLLAAGCLGELSQPSPSKRYYTLNPLRDGAPLLEKPLSERIKIRRLTAAPSFSSRELVYKLEDGAFVTDYYHLFLAPPADQVSQAMTRWIRDAGLFAAVLPPSSSTDSLYVLETNIEELYADYSAKPSQTMARLHATLIRDDGMEYSIIMDRTYSERASVEGEGAAGVVQAMEAAFAAMFAQLELDIAEQVADSEN
ncbi:hypothetical protein DPQ33_01880 [Oceanidesulfovibrio indonesiensis]|uniref:ABC-type transport auxiliary lipoprotein component domain-containing protein n=1 Tax=Oceanidesulfovibrio indonesiensis TaxID=54767 RepID=A0A7M3MJZ4_9BACT|nr:ABC-type transport auxiliary lipoprotein family protein [Oceanidesulfovibrio indonesiensis]TVM20000.1 hypothetical protein DPQ33_01880 [Oceanidesulfovibrio indonesiensis]